MRAEEKKLLRLLETLSAEQQDTVFAFVEFLAARNPVVDVAVSLEPLAIPRPAEESVVKAIKRLRETYPMLSTDQLLHEASGFMMKHVMHGKPAVEAIDELEALFTRYYESHKAG
jgi:predicted metal-dependent hydrolase